MGRTVCEASHPSDIKFHASSFSGMEKALNSMVDTFIQFHRSLQGRMKSDLEWTDAQMNQVRFSTMGILKSLLDLQNQILQKYEILIKASLSPEEQLNYPAAYKLNEAIVLPAFRMFLKQPGDWKRIRLLLRELNQFAEKKMKVGRRCTAVSVKTRPWINTALVCVEKKSQKDVPYKL